MSPPRYSSPNRDLPIRDSVEWFASHRLEGSAEPAELDFYAPVAQSVALTLPVRWLQTPELCVVKSRAVLRPVTLPRSRSKHSSRRHVGNPATWGKSAQGPSVHLEQPNHGKISLLPRSTDAIPGLPTVGQNQMFDKRISHREPGSARTSSYRSHRRRWLRQS